MPTNYFPYVAQIVGANKYFNISQEEIERILRQDGKIKITADHEVECDDGSKATVEVSLHITSSKNLWSATLVMHGQRIDGVDHELRYRSYQEETCSGWHRHIWSAQDQSAEKLKHPLTTMGEVKNTGDFINRITGIMNLSLNRADYGNYELRFDQD